MSHYTCGRCGKPSSHQGHYAFTKNRDEISGEAQWDAKLGGWWGFCCPKETK